VKNDRNYPEVPFDSEVVWAVLNGPYVFPIEGGRQNFNPLTLKEVEARVPDGARFRTFYIKEYIRRHRN